MSELDPMNPAAASPSAETRDELLARLRRSGEDDAGQLVAGATSPAADMPDADDTAPPAPAAPRVDAVYDERPPEITLPLAHPFTIDGRRFDAIELRPPSVQMVRAVAAGAATLDDLYAEMAGVPVDALLALRWPDAERFEVNARLIAPEMRRT